MLLKDKGAPADTIADVQMNATVVAKDQSAIKDTESDIEVIAALEDAVLDMKEAALGMELDRDLALEPAPAVAAIEGESDRDHPNPLWLWGVELPINEVRVRLDGGDWEAAARMLSEPGLAGLIFSATR